MAAHALLGRARELAELEAALEDACAGRGRALLLAGEPGIGKTRLAEELSERARRRGAAVLWGRAWEVAGAPPLWPWTQVVRACADLAEARGFLEADALGRALAPLRAEPTAPGRAASQEPSLLGEALGALLRRAAGPAGLLVVLDDLHAADLASLELLRQVARALREARVLLVGTYREIEARRAPGVGAALGRVARAGTVLPLGPLDAGAVAGFLEAILGAPPAPALLEAVAAASEGNPLFVEGLARVVAARARTAAPLAPGFALPDTLRAALEERLGTLSPAARAVLEPAAVLGRECALARLQAVCDASPAEVLAALGEACAAGVVEAPLVPDVPVRFSHVLVREALYQGLAPAHRIALHARCAAALQRLAAADRDAHVAELAHHLHQAAPAGSWLEAAEASRAAADRALALLAFDDAAGHLERGLAALDAAGSEDPVARAELLWRLGLAQLRLGQGRAGRESCARAAALARTAGADALHARAALAYGSDVAPGRVERPLVELLEAALASPLADPALRAQVKARLAGALMPTLAPERPHELARQAIAEARAQGEARALAEVIATARAAFTPADDLAERAALDRELSGLARSLADPLLAAQAHGRLAILAMEAGEPGEVEAQLRYQAEAAAAARLGQPRLRGACLRLMWATLRDDAGAAARAEEEIHALAERTEDGRGLSVVAANRLARARLHGDEVGARDARDAAAALEAALGADPAMAWWLPVRRAAAAAEAGRADEARAALNGFSPDGPLLALQAMGPALLTLVVPICVGLREEGWLRPMYERLLPLAGRHAVNMGLLVGDGPVAYHLGVIAAALDRGSEAAAHLADAAARCQRAGYPALEARARRALEALRPDLPGAGAAALAPSVPAPDPPALERDGELWVLRYGGREVRLRDGKGLHYLAALLREPGRERHVAELAGLGAGEGPAGADGPPSAGDAGELLDAQARRTYRRRLDAIAEARARAEALGDAARTAALDEERAALAGELARAVGLGGRGRRAGAAAERARVNVQRRLRDVVDRVARADAALGRELALHLRTGTYCVWLV